MVYLVLAVTLCRFIKSRGAVSVPTRAFWRGMLSWEYHGAAKDFYLSRVRVEARPPGLAYT